MIFFNHYQKLAPMCMQEKLVFSTNTRMLKNCSFLNNEFSSLCELFIDNKLSMHFGKDKIKSILFSKARGLKLIFQPHFDYRCSSWFSLLKKNLKHKLMYSFLLKLTSETFISIHRILKR